MQRREPGRDLRLSFPADDRVLEVTAGTEEPEVLADAIIEAMGAGDADEAERVLRSGTPADTEVKRIG